MRARERGGEGVAECGGSWKGEWDGGRKVKGGCGEGMGRGFVRVFQVKYVSSRTVTEESEGGGCERRADARGGDAVMEDGVTPSAMGRQAHQPQQPLSMD